MTMIMTSTGTTATAIMQMGLMMLWRMRIGKRIILEKSIIIMDLSEDK
jgi:hypothetical protein